MLRTFVVLLFVLSCSANLLITQQAKRGSQCAPTAPCYNQTGECTKSEDCVLDEEATGMSAECTVAVCELDHSNATKCRFLPSNAYMPCELEPEEGEIEPTRYGYQRRGYYVPTPTPELPEVSEPEQGICNKTGFCVRCEDVKQCVHGTCEFEENPIVEGALVAKCWCEENWLGHACDVPSCNFKGAWNTTSESCNCFANYTGANCTQCASTPESSDETFRCVRLETREKAYALVRMLKDQVDTPCVANRSVVPGQNGTDCLCNIKEPEEEAPEPTPPKKKKKKRPSYLSYDYDYGLEKRGGGYRYKPTPTPMEPDTGEEKDVQSNEEKLLEQLRWCKNECIDGILYAGELYRNNNDTCNNGIDIPLQSDLPSSPEEDPTRPEDQEFCSDQTLTANSANHYPVLQFDDTKHHYAQYWSTSASDDKDDFFATLTSTYDRCYAVGCPRKDAELVNQKYDDTTTQTCGYYCSNQPEAAPSYDKRAYAPTPSPTKEEEVDAPSQDVGKPSFCDHLACLDNFVSECATSSICTTTPRDKTKQSHYYDGNNSAVDAAWAQVKALNPDKLDELNAYEAANSPIDELDVALFSAAFQSCFLNGCAANATKTQSCFSACSDYEASNSVFCQLFFQQGAKAGLIDEDGNLSCTAKPTQAKCDSFCEQNPSTCQQYCETDNRAFECCEFCGQNPSFSGCKDVCEVCAAGSSACAASTMRKFDDNDYLGLAAFAVVGWLAFFVAFFCGYLCRDPAIEDLAPGVREYAQIN